MDKKIKERERKRAYRAKLSEDEKNAIKEKNRQYSKKKRQQESEIECAVRKQMRKNKTRIAEVKMNRERFEEKKTKNKERVKKSIAFMDPDERKQKVLKSVHKHRKKCGKRKKKNFWGGDWEKFYKREEIQKKKLKEKKREIYEKLQNKLEIREALIKETREKISAENPDISVLSHFILTGNNFETKENMKDSEIQDYPRIVAEIHKKKISNVKKELVTLFPGSYGKNRINAGFYIE